MEVCEREEDRSFEVNARAVKRLAQRCAEAGARFVHLSTNYVFDGSAAEPYDERDLPNPRSIYAISKLAGEYAALAYAPDALVVRTAGLYGLHGSASKGGNFVTRMIARAKRAGCAEGRRRPAADPDVHRRPRGRHPRRRRRRDERASLHLTNSGSTSWHGFTEAIMQLAGVDVPVERRAAP